MPQSRGVRQEPLGELSQHALHVHAPVPVQSPLPQSCTVPQSTPVAHGLVHVHAPVVQSQRPLA